MLKILLMRIQNVVLMKVLEQDVVNTVDGQVHTLFEGGIDIVSAAQPGLCDDIIFVRGAEQTGDNGVASLSWNNVEEACVYYQKVKETVEAYNKLSTNACSEPQKIKIKDEHIDCVEVGDDSIFTVILERFYNRLSMKLVKSIDIDINYKFAKTGCKIDFYNGIGITAKHILINPNDTKSIVWMDCETEDAAKTHFKRHATAINECVEDYKLKRMTTKQSVPFGFDEYCIIG